MGASRYRFVVSHSVDYMIGEANATTHVVMTCLKSCRVHPRDALYQMHPRDALYQMSRASALLATTISLGSQNKTDLNAIALFITHNGGTG